MNRDIKFRAWDETNKKMYEVVSLEKRRAGLNIKVIGEIWETMWLLLDQLEIMQYTGLKDKNGNEIYEGDIVNYQDKHHLDYSGVYEISFKYGKFGYHEERKHFSALDSLYVHERIQGWKPNIKVIGNIYENPELLR